MKLNTNSNVYTIIYATIIVVIVAFLLAVVSSALRPRQEANVAIDKKKQILSSLALDSLWTKQNVNVDTLYAQVITETQWENMTEVNDTTVLIDTLTIYVANLAGDIKYILPMDGAGLWGGIWGYLALDYDKTTIYGAYFNHASETPGLGGEIATKGFQERFVGKSILTTDTLNVLDPYQIAIVKAGKTVENMANIDAISGATITSKGVETMVNTTLSKYQGFLKSRMDIVIPENEETQNEKEE